MTYTFKLSRRLAVSRYAMLAAAALLVGCDGETTAPEPDLDPVPALARVKLVPSRVTVETNQTVRFRGLRQSPRGDRHELPLTWHASGGSIDDDGIFAATTPGTYKVIGKGRGRQKSDTSIVVVVPPQPDIVAVSVSPDTATLGPGGTQTFAAVGVLSDGTTVAVGVNWQATGGSVDAGGAYTAGTTAGSYRVIAANTDGTLADTVAVTVTQAPPPPPAPTLDQVVLSPATLALTTGATARFAAYGRNSLGDSVAVEVTYSASGGSISSDGLYTAGSSGGSFRVIASAGTVADTTPVTLTSPFLPAPPPSTGRSMPFGASQVWNSLGTSSTDAYDLAHEGVRAGGIIQRIADARARHVRLLLNMTGGHDPYMSTIDGVLQFDMQKWRDSMRTYNSADIKDAVAKAVADGVIIGNSVMDEPHVIGLGDGNTWGPAGTMTKARVDSMCAYVKTIFPTMPVGVVHQHQNFEPTKSYRVCEFLVDQYQQSFGDVTAWRDAGLAMGQRDNMRILFGANELNGGPKDKDGTWDCKDQGGLKGQYSPLCQIPPDSLKRWYPILARGGCGFRIWRWDAVRLSTTTYREAHEAVRDSLVGLTAPTCGRP
ncbi:MAG TPA: hypothetical protein VJQ44_18745 [Gemmatimonadales bacterium]|nr:hypothetical protein [Gemmatimonadales bacterium]